MVSQQFVPQSRRVNSCGLHQTRKMKLPKLLTQWKKTHHDKGGSRFCARRAHGKPVDSTLPATSNDTTPNGIAMMEATRPTDTCAVSMMSTFRGPGVWHPPQTNHTDDNDITSTAQIEMMMCLTCPNRPVEKGLLSTTERSAFSPRQSRRREREVSHHPFLCLFGRCEWASNAALSLELLELLALPPSTHKSLCGQNPSLCVCVTKVSSKASPARCSPRSRLRQKTEIACMLEHNWRTPSSTTSAATLYAADFVT